MRMVTGRRNGSVFFVFQKGCVRKMLGTRKNRQASPACMAVIVLYLLTGTLMCSAATQSNEEKLSSGTSASGVLRTGIWVMQHVPEDDAQFLEFERGVRGNPHLSGVALGAGWDEVEKEPGGYHFEGFDRAIAVLRDVGMKYKLGIKPGTNTPQFVYQKGAAAFPSAVINPHRPNYGEEVALPLPWDPIFQEYYSRLIRALGERYSRDPLCVSVALTCANFLSGEMHLPKRPEDMERWKSNGDYKAKLLDVYRKYTDEWAAAFPRQEICLHVSPVLHFAPSEFTEKVIEYGISKYPSRFAIQNCSLSGRREDEGKEAYEIIRIYKDRVHHGFQSLASFLTQQDRMGTPEMAALNQVHAGGSYWELWHGDGMSVAVSEKVAKVWEEAKRMGYEAYKAKLVAGGLYRKIEDDTYSEELRRTRRRK